MWSYSEHGGTRPTKHSRCCGVVSIPYGFPFGQQEPGEHTPWSHQVCKSKREQLPPIESSPLWCRLEGGSSDCIFFPSKRIYFFPLVKTKLEFLFENEFLCSGFSQTFPQGTIELQYISNLKLCIVDEILKITRLGNPNICYFQYFLPQLAANLWHQSWNVGTVSDQYFGGFWNAQENIDKIPCSEFIMHCRLHCGFLK